MARTQDTTTRPDTMRTVSPRLPADLHARLLAAAKAADMPASHLARALIQFGLAELAAGNPAVKRAIKISRD